MVPSKKVTTTNRYTVAAVMFLVWAFHLLPFLIPEARLWGVNHLLFLPPIATIFFIAGGLVSLLLVLNRPLRVRSYSWCERIANSVFGKGETVRFILISILSIIVFWLLRRPTHFLGDGYTLLHAYARDLPTLYKWSEIGSIMFIAYLTDFLPYSGLALTKFTFGIISVAAGGFTIFIFYLLIKEMTQEAAPRFFMFGLMLLSGWMLLFFGYAEHYPMIWPVVVAYLYFGVKCTRGKRGLGVATICLAIAIVLHLQLLFFLISYPVLLFSCRRGEIFYKKYNRTIWMAIALVFISGTIIFIELYRGDIGFEFLFVPFWAARPLTPYYSMLSSTHLLDVTNQLLLLVPVFPVLLIIKSNRWRAFFRDRSNLFLLAFTLGGFAFLFLIDPKLGMGRDWDLFALAGLGPALILGMRFVGSKNNVKHFAPGLILLAITLVFPFFAVNLKTAPAIENYKYLLNLDKPLSKAGLVVLRDYYRDIGDQIRVDSINVELKRQYPSIAIGARASQLAEEGRYNEALILAERLIREDPYSREYLNIRGWVYLLMGSYTRAAADLEKSLQLYPYDTRILCNLADAYYCLGRLDESIDKLRQAQNLVPDNLYVNSGLASGFYTREEYDSALVYAAKVIKQQPNYASGYMIAGISASKIGDPVAKRYLSKYLQIAPEGPDKEYAKKLLQQIEE